MAHICQCLPSNYFYVLKLAGQAPLSEPAYIWLLPPSLGRQICLYFALNMSVTYLLYIGQCVAPMFYSQCRICELILCCPRVLWGVYKYFTTLQEGRCTGHTCHGGQCTWTVTYLCTYGLLPPTPTSHSYLLAMVRILTPARRGQPPRVMQGQEWRANRILRLSREIGTILANSNDPFRYWLICFEEIRRCIIQAYLRTAGHPSREE